MRKFRNVGAFAGIVQLSITSNGTVSGELRRPDTATALLVSGYLNIDNEVTLADVITGGRVILYGELGSVNFTVSGGTIVERIGTNEYSGTWAINKAL